jgi:hypothetical protein
MPKLLLTKMNAKSPIEDLTLFHTEISEGDYKGLYGVKIFSNNDEEDEFGEPIGLEYNKILKTIDLMIET